MPRGSSEQGTAIASPMKWTLSLLKKGARSLPSLLQGCPSPFHPLKESLGASKTELSAHQSPAGGAIRTGVLSAQAIMWPSAPRALCAALTEGEGYLVMDMRLSAAGMPAKESLNACRPLSWEKSESTSLLTKR